MRSSAVAAWCAVALGAAQIEPADVVARASAYAARYDTELGGFVAQEDYRQDLPQQRRRLKSDFMLVKFSNEGSWLPFRDVIEADGKPVGDRTVRLERLFLAADPAAARENAERLSRESSRYNLGRHYRSTNTPVIGLEYLKPYTLEQSRFATPRHERLDGEEAWRVDFEERGPRTVVHKGDGEPFPAKGTIWVRAADGAVLRTLVRLETYLIRSHIDVRFCAAPSIAVLVPCKMTENYNAAGEQITSVATYSNIRQFRVSTTEIIKH